MEELTQYIKSDFAVLVAVLYCIGRGLKAIQRFPNQFIPLALTFCGIGLACLSVVSRYASYGNWAAALFEGVVQGVLCAGMSVYLNEVIAHCSSNNKGYDPPKLHAQTKEDRSVPTISTASDFRSRFHLSLLAAAGNLRYNTHINSVPCFGTPRRETRLVRFTNSDFLRQGENPLRCAFNRWSPADAAYRR